MLQSIQVNEDLEVFLGGALSVTHGGEKPEGRGLGSEEGVVKWVLVTENYGFLKLGCERKERFGIGVKKSMRTRQRMVRVGQWGLKFHKGSCSA